MVIYLFRGESDDDVGKEASTRRDGLNVEAQLLTRCA